MQNSSGKLSVKCGLEVTGLQEGSCETDVIQIKGGVCISFPKASVTIAQTVWLKAIVMYCFTVLKAIRLRSRCQQSPTPSRGFRAGSIPASFSCWWLQLALVCSYITPNVKAKSSDLSSLSSHYLLSVAPVQSPSASFL